MSDIRIIDAHTHAQFPEFDADREAVMRRAKEAGVGMINVGADIASSEKAVELAKKNFGWAWAAVGVHPTELDDAPSFEKIISLAADSSVVGIGECGLDYFHITDGAARQEQKDLFVRHIALSRESKKPLVIHCRRAFADAIDLLRANRSALNAEPGVVHFFTGTIDDARALLELNFSFTFGGLITFNRTFDDVLKFIPRDHLLIETDAPFVSPAPYRGKRNEPAHAIEVARALAGVLDVDRADLAMTLFETTRRVFHCGA